MVRCTWDRIDIQVAEQTAHPTAVRGGGRVLLQIAVLKSTKSPNYSVLFRKNIFTPAQRRLTRALRGEYDETHAAMDERVRSGYTVGLWQLRREASCLAAWIG